MHIASGFLGRLCAALIYKDPKTNTLQKHTAHCPRNLCEAVCSMTNSQTRRVNVRSKFYSKFEDNLSCIKIIFRPNLNSKV